MPGIVDMDFKCLNRGSIKKASLNIKAHNKNQFDVIDVLYLRLGYSVFLEWGYDKYLDNKNEIQRIIVNGYQKLRKKEKKQMGIMMVYLVLSLIFHGLLMTMVLMI